MACPHSVFSDLPGEIELNLSLAIFTQHPQNFKEFDTSDKMAPKKTSGAPKENISLGPNARDGMIPFSGELLAEMAVFCGRSLP